MDKLKTTKIIALSILGACNVLIDLATPLMLALILSRLDYLSASDYLLYGVAISASLFRAIKFWIKE